MGCSCKFNGPSIVSVIPGYAAYPAEGVHPFGEIVKVLAVSIPLKLLVKWFVRPSFRQFFADSEPPGSRMKLALLVAQAAYPAASRVTVTVAAKDMMYLSAISVSLDLDLYFMVE